MNIKKGLLDSYNILWALCSLLYFIVLFGISTILMIGVVFYLVISREFLSLDTPGLLAFLLALSFLSNLGIEYGKRNDWNPPFWDKLTRRDDSK